jgi:hypothetical protein
VTAPDAEIDPLRVVADDIVFTPAHDAATARTARGSAAA